MSRIRAFLLLALFLGAGTSLPGLDAVLYHHHPERQPDQVHYDPAGGCGGHADHCTLSRTPPGSQSVLPRVTVFRVITHEAVPAVQALVSRIIVGTLRTLPQPRAPPALTV
jgi:hypothetical protein